MTFGMVSSKERVFSHLALSFPLFFLSAVAQLFGNLCSETFVQTSWSVQAFTASCSRKQTHVFSVHHLSVEYLNNLLSL